MPDFGLAARADQTGSRIPAQAGRDSELAAEPALVAEIISGKRHHFAPAAIAAVCFTEPEVVVAGQTPTDAAKAGLDCITAQFPFAANGRAMTLESTDGFVRVVARRDNHRIVDWAAVRAVGLPAALLIPMRGQMPGLAMVNGKIGVQPS